MSSTQRLALKIAAYTVAVLALGLAVLGGIIIARAPAAKSPEMFIQQGHAGVVYSVAWSPDDKTLASGSWDNTVKLWEAGSGQLLRTLSGHASYVMSVAWSPDGKTLV
jgi:WD40 repeat protein